MATSFDRIWSEIQSPDSPQIANVFAAYQAGKMPPKDAAQFEADVMGGHVMLPAGASLKASAPDAGGGAHPLPATVLKAYSDGTMPSADKAQLEADVRAGLVALPAGVELAQGVARVAIPGAQRVVPPEQAPAPGLADQAIGLGEAGLTALTGATGGALGMVGGLGKGLAQEIISGQFGTPQANDVVAHAMNEGAAALTYAPRTPAGQQYAETLGNGMAQLVPVMPLAGEMAGLSAGGRAARSGAPAGVLARAGAEGAARDAAGLVARPAEAAGMVAPGAAGEAAAGLVARGVDAAAPVVAKAAGAAQTGAQKVAGLAKGATTLPRRALDALRGEQPEATPTPGTMASGGAAATDMAAQRLALADSLPYPVKLTKGMISRDPDQLKFEVETAKLPEVGKPLRDNRIEATGQLLKNADWLIDQTGAEAGLPRQVGENVDAALMGELKRAKTEVRVAYKKAEAAGELAEPVALTDLVDHLNAAAPEEATAPLIATARKLAVKLGIAKDEGGTLVAVGSKPEPYSSLTNAPPSGGVTLGQAERFRQAINRNTDFEPTNIRQATIIKGLIDKATDGMGGDLYKAARQKRMEMAQRFEDRAAIAKLVNNKRGMADRQVAFEDVFQHSILKGSADDTAHILGVLKTSGADGLQAVKELQGATLRHIIDEATRSANSDSAGQRILSPDALNKQIRTLDADGKLDLVLGKKNAQFLRDINELTQIAKTVPPEAGINYSNTSSALLSALGDASVMGFTGAPVPVVTLGRFMARYVKDRALKQRINDALRNGPIKAPGRGGSTTPEQFPGATAQTIH